jgi:hypothetical protein
MSQHDAHGRAQATRRRLLAASGAAALTAVAGCSAVVDAIANQVLGEVNVFNQLDRDVSGSITVRTPSSDTALDETFDLPSVETDGESNFVAYDGVWGEPGDYEFSVELSSSETEAASEAEKTVAVDETDEDMIGVAIGADVVDELIAIRAGRSLSDFGWQEHSNQTARRSKRER